MLACSVLAIAVMWGASILCSTLYGVRTSAFIAIVVATIIGLVAYHFLYGVGRETKMCPGGSLINCIKSGKLKTLEIRRNIIFTISCLITSAVFCILLTIIVINMASPSYSIKYDGNIDVTKAAVLERDGGYTGEQPYTDYTIFSAEPGGDKLLYQNSDGKVCYLSGGTMYYLGEESIGKPYTLIDMFSSGIHKKPPVEFAVFSVDTLLSKYPDTYGQIRQIDKLNIRDAYR
jgi:hypothetical protein